MAKPKPQVLIVEDDPVLLEDYLYEWADENAYELIGAESLKQARAELAKTRFSVVLTDIKLRTANEGGFEILIEIKKARPETKVVIFTGIGNTDIERQATRLRADEYIPKPLKYDLVKQVIKTKIIEHEQYLEAKERGERRRRTKLPTPERLVAGCSIMRELVNNAARLARSSENVLIIGEPGTGKGLLAEGIHLGSGRPGFELVTCGSLSELTLDRAIFGWLDEATAAEHGGLLSRLAGGTLVLDKVADLSPRLQEKLHSAIKDGCYKVSKDTPPIEVNVRVISLNQFDLSDAVKQGLFSKELFEALAQNQLIVPPLRERRDADGLYVDVLMLAEHFLKKHSVKLEGEDAQPPALSEEVEYILQTYPFPGNVRELGEAIRLSLGNLSKAEDIILSGHLPANMRRYGVQSTLGVIEDESETSSILCPHGDLYCNQAASIGATHRSTESIYVCLSSDLSSEFVAQVQRELERHGLQVVHSEELSDALTGMCAVCRPIQASKYAIIDISNTKRDVFYELGLLHALGVKTLMLNKHSQSLPARFKRSAITEYRDEKQLVGIVQQWAKQIAQPTP